MSSASADCRTVQIHAFLGDRSRAFVQQFQRKLDDERTGKLGPSRLESFLFLGHAGVSLHPEPAIGGFSPDAGAEPLWSLLAALRSGKARKAIVQDDTAVFTAAAQQGLTILSYETLLPDFALQKFRAGLDRQRAASDYSYGFPNGDGDCNCVTWLERLSLPLLTGRLNEFAKLTGIKSLPRRRFGVCVP